MRTVLLPSWLLGGLTSLLTRGRATSGPPWQSEIYDPDVAKQLNWQVDQQQREYIRWW